MRDRNVKDIFLRAERKSLSPMMEFAWYTFCNESRELDTPSIEGHTTMREDSGKK